MTVLDQVTQLKNQGFDDNSISQELTNQGVAPKNIQDALSQLQIKSAITNNNQMENYEQPAQGMTQEVPQMPEQGYAQETYAAAPQEEYYDPNAGQGSSMIIELAGQVVDEKMSKFLTQIEELNEFKTLTQVKLDHLEESTKRIQDMFDKLQLAILDKVGSYGQNLDSIKKEMNMMQETFSKTLPKIKKE